VIRFELLVYMGGSSLL